MIPYAGKQLASAFRTVRENTVQIAEEIPEDKYDFVAAPGVQSVRALLTHIAVSPMLYDEMHRVRHVATLQGFDFPALMARAGAIEKEPRTKAQIVDFLRAEGQRFSAWLESLTPEFLAETFTDVTGLVSRTRLESLLSPKEHEMHHRGQLMLIERMLGITPHLTRRRQEMMAARQATSASAS
jgi:uncharacterized damage-inducible protein DinB